MQIIPALDIIDDKLVRLIKGDYAEKIIYSDDPLATAQQFADAGVTRLHLVDLSGAKSAIPVHAKLFGQIKAKTGLQIEAGGGIRSIDHIEQYLNAGLTTDDFFMIGSLPFTSPENFDQIVERFAKNILLTVDVWGRDIRISGWQKSAAMEIHSFLRKMVDRNLKSFLVTQIQKDGMLQGPDFDLYAEILSQHQNISLIASGGVSGVADFEKLKKISGLTGAILGRAFYENHITLQDLRSLT